MEYFVFVIFIFIVFPVLIVVILFSSQRSKQEKLVKQMDDRMFSVRDNAIKLYGEPTTSGGNSFNYYFIFENKQVIIINGEIFYFANIRESYIADDGYYAQTNIIGGRNNAFGVTQEHSFYAVHLSVSDYSNPIRIIKCGEDFYYASQLNSVLHLIIEHQYFAENTYTNS